MKKQKNRISKEVTSNKTKNKHEEEMTSKVDIIT